MIKSSSLLTLGFIMLGSTSAFAAPAWTIVPQLSHLTFETKQSDKMVTGEFKTFTPTILFDKADLATSHISVTIDMASASTGDSTNDGALPTKDWLNVGAFPTATFESTAITAKGQGSAGVDFYEAVGKLTILGTTHDVVLPFTLQETGANTHALGMLQLKRLDYGVGASIDPNGTMVSQDVTVKFDITAHPTQAQ